MQRRKDGPRMINLLLKRQECQNTLVDHNEAVKLELLRAWEPLGSSKPLQTCKGSSSHGVLFNRNAVRQEGL